MSSFLKAAAATDPSLIQQGLFDHGRAFAALQHSAASTSPSLDQPRPTSVSVRLPAISGSGTPTAASKFTTSGDRLMSQSRNAEEPSIRWKSEVKHRDEADGEADAVSMSSSQQSSWRRAKVDDPRSNDRTDNSNGLGVSGDTSVGADVNDHRPTTFSAARARRKSSKQAAGHTVNTFAVHGRPLVPPRPDGVGFFGESLAGRPAVSSGGGGGCPNPRFAPARVEEKQTQQQRRKAEERERRIERLHATQEQARVRLAQQCIAAAALSPLFHSPVQLSNPVLKHDVDDE